MSDHTYKLLPTCWLETRLGSRYEVPDMTTAHMDSVCQQLDSHPDTITVVNVSNVIMIFPKRILAKAGTGNRCFWEASCAKLNPPGEGHSG